MTDTLSKNRKLFKHCRKFSTWNSAEQFETKFKLNSVFMKIKCNFVDYQRFTF